MFFYFLALILGIISGTITGLIPGIHTNLIMGFLITLNLKINSNYLLIYVIATSLTHTFIDFIPTILFGAPSEDTVLGINPGHYFLLNKKAYHAIIYTLYGSTIAIFLLIIITPLFILILKKVYSFIQTLLPLILLSIILFFIQTQNQKKSQKIIIIFLSSLLGFITLNSSINQPLLPLLTGFFGLSQIIVSTKKRIIPPKQEINKVKLSKKELIRPTLTTLLISPLCSILPGLGASQAATFGQIINKNKSKKQFLILLGSINTLVITTSIITLYLINKKRTGLANFLSQLNNLTNQKIILIILTIILTTIISFYITKRLSKLFVKNLYKINYIKINYFILFFIILLVLFISHMVGLVILITSTIIGIITIEEKLPRTILMSSIIIPTILNSLP